MSFVAAAVGGASYLVGSYIQGQSAKKAAGAQEKAAMAGIAETRRQFDAMQKLMSPYVEAGNQSMVQQQNLAGLNGREAQNEAISGISGSAEFAQMAQQGESALLQNASATGGVRGGNTQAALAQFRPQMLSGLLNQQYQRLGGITQLGQASAAGVGAAGMQSGSQIAGLLGQQGAAVAGGQLAQGQAWASPFNTIGQLAGGYAMNQLQQPKPAATVAP